MKLIRAVLVLNALLLINTNVYAQKRPQGGTFTTAILSEPTSLNPISTNDASASGVLSYIFEGLLDQNVDTYEWEPNLAESWEISKDKKEFTFKLREGLKWADGKPLTVEDVKFSFEAIKNPKYKALAKLPYLEGISKCEIVDERTVKFVASNTYFQNFDMVAGGIVTILPKHIYQDPKAKVNKDPVGSGPYKLEKYEKGRRIILAKNPNWWGWEKAKKDGTQNFDKIAFRFVDSPNVQLEMLKKGDIDYMGLQPEDYVLKTNTPEWGKSLVKVKTDNEGSKGYNWIGLNQKNPILADRQVRLALAHLVNRDLMIEKFRHGMAIKTAGPGLFSEYIPNDLKPISFDVKKAVELLKAAGWTDTDKDGVLDKVLSGKKTKLSIEILIPTDLWTKYLTVIKEDGKKAGFEIKIKNIEWNTFTKLLDEKKFDAVTMAWSGGGIQWDPKQIWHSTSGNGGSNYVSYSNPEVDKLIDEARNTWDRKKRADMLKKVNKMIADDVPYIFLFHPKFVTYAHRSEIKKPKDTFRFGVGTSYWWKQ